MKKPNIFICLAIILAQTGCASHGSTVAETRSLLSYTELAAQIRVTRTPLAVDTGATEEDGVVAALR